MMKRTLNLTASVAFGVTCIGTLVSAAEASSVALPTAAKRPVDFAKDIAPILLNSCAQCHAGGKQKGEFQMDSRERFLKGGEAGVVVIVGSSAKSLLIELVTNTDADKLMCKKGRKIRET